MGILNKSFKPTEISTLLCTISKKKKKVKKDVPTVKEIDDKIEEIKNEMKDETDEEVYNILEDSKKSKKKK